MTVISAICCLTHLVSLLLGLHLNTPLLRLNRCKRRQATCTLHMHIVYINPVKANIEVKTYQSIKVK